MNKARLPVFLMILLTAFAYAHSMPDGNFNGLLKSLENANFSDDKLNVLRSAASSNTFTSSQVGQILRKFDFSSDQLAALRLMKDRIEDHQNRHTIIEVFSYSSDKEEAQRILAQARAVERPRHEGRRGGGECRCMVVCSEGSRSTLSLSYEESDDEMDRNCGRKASRFCSSNYEKLQKATVDCGR